MGLENVKYDAFISYRHCDLDKFNAMNIQRKLENFKLPKSLYGKTNGKTKIERVFRDQDELPLASNLSDPIEEALKNSEFLIVICTPRLPESQWCAKEIDTFIKLHGREHVLAVLAEGEPDQSFPEKLRFAQRITVDELGNEHEETVEIEPLAADTRGASQKEIKKHIDDAVIRLAAPIFGLNYDDLKQRHKEQRTKRIITIASIVAAVFFVFAMVCMGLALRISSQKDTIEDQYVEIEKQNKEITAKSEEIKEANVKLGKQNRELQDKNEQIYKQNEEITAQNEEISRQYRAEQLKYAESMADVSTELLTAGRKLDALYALRNAMPDTTDSADIPYCAAAEKALADSLGIYNRDATMTPDFKYELLSTPQIISLSPDGKFLAAFDSSSNFYVFDTNTGKEISTFRMPAQDNLGQIDWISDTTCVYLAGDGLHAYTPAEDKNVIIGEENVSPNDYVISHDYKKIFVYEFDFTAGCSYMDTYSTEGSFERLGRLAVLDGASYAYDSISMKMGISESDTFLYILTKEAFNISFDHIDCTLNIFNLAENSGIIESLNLSTYCDSYITDNALYLLTAYSSNSGYTTYNSVIYSMDVKTGDTNWNREYANCFLDDLSYGKSGKNGELIIDAQGQIIVLNAKTGDELSYITYDGQLSKGYVLQDKKAYQRLMITRTGNLLLFDSSSDYLINKTYNYYKYLPTGLVNDCAFNGGRYYFCYNNESYIAGFGLIDNSLRTAEDIFSLPDADSHSYNTYEFSDDYKYAVITYRSENGYTHAFCDMVNRKVLCEVEDSHLFAGMFSGVNDKFYSYSSGSNLYSASGELINSVDPYTTVQVSFNAVSNNGKYLLYSNSVADDLSKAHIVYSPEKGEIIYTVKTQERINRILADDVNEKLFLIDDSTVSAYSFSDSSKPVASVDLELSFVRNCFISDDGKYLFFDKMNNDIDVYDAATLSFVKTLYCSESTLSDTVYIKDTNEYLFIVANGISFILNDSLECKKVVYDCVGYDASSNSYITKYVSLGHIENVSYEDMIKLADEELNGYEPSDFIKDKYHID